MKVTSYTVVCKMSSVIFDINLSANFKGSIGYVNKSTTRMLTHVNSRKTLYVYINQPTCEGF